MYKLFSNVDYFYIVFFRLIMCLLEVCSLSLFLCFFFKLWIEWIEMFWLFHFLNSKICVNRLFVARLFINHITDIYRVQEHPLCFPLLKFDFTTDMKYYCNRKKLNSWDMFIWFLLEHAWFRLLFWFCKQKKNLLKLSILFICVIPCNNLIWKLKYRYSEYFKVLWFKIVNKTKRT